MNVPQEDLDPYQRRLQSESSRERDNAAEELADYLQYRELAAESRLAVGRWLLDALWKEQDEVVLESVLHALGWINFQTACPELEWRRLAEYLPKLEPPLLGEYAISTLGESEDRSMIPYLEEYRDHPDAEVRNEAEKAIRFLMQR